MPQLIEAPEAQKLIADKKVVVLDVRTPAEFARRWSPSPSTTVVEQTGEPVKDSLTARKTGASLTDSPARSKGPDTRVKGKSEGVMI